MDGLAAKRQSMAEMQADKVNADGRAVGIADISGDPPESLQGIMRAILADLPRLIRIRQT
jgi:hypothetical protein